MAGTSPAMTKKAMPDPTTLRIALGDYPHTLPLKRGEITSPWLTLDFVEVKPMYKAFLPMVREHAYDASEMALVTAIQAKAYNKGLKLLPAAMLSRFQHGTVLYNSARGKLTPADLPGKRIGVRSYSQTTGVWIRGILENDYESRPRARAVGDVRGRPCRRSQRSARRDPRQARSGHHADAARRRARCRHLRRRHAGRPAPEDR